MNITVNSKQEKTTKSNLLEYLNEKNINTNTIVIEYNYKVIKKENWGEITLSDGDNLEILSFVGGG